MISPAQNVAPHMLIFRADVLYWNLHRPASHVLYSNIPAPSPSRAIPREFQSRFGDRPDGLAGAAACTRKYRIGSRRCDLRVTSCRVLKYVEISDVSYGDSFLPNLRSKHITTTAATAVNRIECNEQRPGTYVLLWCCFFFP